MALITLALSLTGCATTTVYPHGGNHYSSVSLSADQGSAQSDAKAKAEKTCLQQNKKLVVLNQTSLYRGADTQTKIAGTIISGLLGVPNFAISSDDNQIDMHFKCV